jgi:RNA polymerase sigma-70 factor (ECF subfamily)
MMEDTRAKLEWFKTTILPHRRALHARLRTRFDVEDLVSEALTRAWASNDWSRIDKGRAYLFQVARNLVIDLARREKIIAYDTVVDIDLLDSGHSLERQLDARDEVRRLQAILEQMPVQCRRVFVARRVYGKTLAEIAGEMDLSVSTIEKHLAKGIRLLTQALDADGVNGFVERRISGSGRNRAEGGNTARHADR